MLVPCFQMRDLSAKKKQTIKVFILQLLPVLKTSMSSAACPPPPAEFLRPHTTIGRKWVAVFFLRVFFPLIGFPWTFRPTNICRFLFLHSADAYVL